MVFHCSQFPLKPLCVALSLMFVGGATANEDVTSPRIVLPRMVTQQAALGAAQGGQLTLITSNGVLQGPAASMLQIIAPQTNNGVAPSASHASIIANVMRQVHLSAGAIPPPAASGGPVGSLPIGISIPGAGVNSAPLAVSGGLPINVTGTTAINWQTFNTGGGNIAINGSAGGVVLQGGTVHIGTTSASNLGNLVANGRPFVVPPSGITLNTGVAPIGTGALTLTGMGTGGAGGVVGLTGVKPPGAITVR